MNVGYLLGAYTAHGVNAYRESCGNHKKKLRIKVNSKENRSISNETMVLGCIYGVLDTPFSLLGFELISGVLFLLFNNTSH